MRFSPGNICCFVFLIISLSQLNAQTWTWDTVHAETDANYKLALAPGQYSYLYSRDYQPYIQQPFVSRLNPHGKVIWQKNYPAKTSITTVVSLSDSNVAVVGLYYDTVVIGNFTLYPNKPGFNSNSWIATYTDSGILKNVMGLKGTEVRGFAKDGADMIISGTVRDSTVLFGTALNVTYSILFVARIDEQAQLVNLAVGSSSISGAENYGSDCAVAPNGDVYLLAYSYGPTYIGNQPIGQGFPGVTESLICLNHHLELKSETKLYVCQYACSQFHSLRVNSRSEPVVLESYQYNQSGNDKSWSRLLKFSPGGVATGTWSPFSPYQNHIYDIEDISIDSCDRIYYTGFNRNYEYSLKPVSALISGCVERDLSPVWKRADSSYYNSASGRGIVALSRNRIMVAGGLNDTLVLGDTVVNPFPKPTGGFLAIMQVPLNQGCVQVTAGMPDFSSDEELIFPNPSTGLLYFGGSVITKAELLSIDGRKAKALSEVKPSEMIDLTGLPDGIYLLKYSDRNGNMKIRKVILQR